MNKLEKITTLYENYGLGLPIFAYNFKNKRRKFAELSKKVLEVEASDCRLKIRNIDISSILVNLKEDTDGILSGNRRILFFDDTSASQIDIKYKWEIQRAQHLIYLAAQIKDPICREYYLAELENIKSNFSFKETNAMEISIDLINLIVSLQVTNEEYLLGEPEIQCVVLNGLSYILSNAEFGIRFSNNHYFFDLLGVIWITEELEGSDVFQIIHDYAKKELVAFLKTSINEDGSLYEGSTFYHRYVCEALLEYLFFHKDSYKDLLKYAEKMTIFSVNSSFNRNIVRIGDNDSGRVLAIPSYFSYKSTSLDTILLLADKLKLNVQANSKTLNTFGLYIIDSSNWNVAIRCDSITNKMKNKVIGGHFHNDQLSVTVDYNGYPIIVDPGTFLYVEKNNLRINNMKTSNHNTVLINGEEQNYIENDWTYRERKCKGICRSILPYSGIFELQYQNGNNHIRKVNCNDNVLRIQDIIKFRDYDSHVAVASLCFHPNCKIILTEKDNLIIKNDVSTFMLKSNGTIKIIDRWYAEDYGSSKPCKGVDIMFNDNNNVVELEKINETANYI